MEDMEPIILSAFLFRFRRIENSNKIHLQVDFEINMMKVWSFWAGGKVAPVELSNL